MYTGKYSRLGRSFDRSALWDARQLDQQFFFPPYILFPDAAPSLTEEKYLFQLLLLTLWHCDASEWYPLGLVQISRKESEEGERIVWISVWDDDCLDIRMAICEREYRVI